MKRFVIPLIGIALIAIGGWWFIGSEPSDHHTKNENYDGIWNGNFDINGRGNFKFNALYLGGELIAYSPDARVSYKGTVNIENDVYHSDMEMYLLTNGGYFDSVTLEGKVVSPDKIEARFLTHDAKDTGTLKLERNKSLYEKDAQINKVNDEWIYYHGFTITKFTIENNGYIKGADTNGCGYEGEVSVVAPNYNAYRVKLLLNSCHELDGLYQGMAYLLGSVEADDTLNIQVYKDGQALYLPIVRNTKDSESSSQDPT